MIGRLLQNCRRLPINFQTPFFHQSKFQIKAVISDRTDFEATLEAYKSLEKTETSLNFPWVLTPCYNTEEEFPMSRFMNVLSWNEEAGGVFRVIGQQHKWVWGPDQKQV